MLAGVQNYVGPISVIFRYWLRTCTSGINGSRRPSDFLCWSVIIICYVY